MKQSSFKEITYEPETTNTKSRGAEIDEYLDKVKAEKYVLLTWDKEGNLRVATENIPTENLPELMTWTFEKLHRHERARIKRVETALIQKANEEIERRNINVGNYSSEQMVGASLN